MDYRLCVDDLLNRSYALIDLPDAAARAAEAVIVEGRRFFESDAAEKLASANPSILEGYRSLGSEKDAVTGRPDLMETFSTWFRNQDGQDPRKWAASCQLHAAMRSALVPFAQIAEEVLSTLATELAGAGWLGQVPPIRDLSYLQTNFSRPAEHRRSDRQTLMDGHEDGHLLTIVVPTQPGLVGCPGDRDPKAAYDEFDRFIPRGGYEPIDTRPGQAVIMSGSPTYYMTAGRVRPLFHAVENLGHRERQSLMFFANPDRGTPIRPWLVSEENRDVDVHQVVEMMSQKYGQPALSEAFSKT